MVRINDFNPQCITYSQMEMIFNMRIYYRRIINLTKIYMRNRYYNLGAPDVLFDRLYLEYLDLGTMLHLNFGRTNQDQYSRYLGQFTIDLRELITAQIAGDKAAIDQRVQSLYNNVDTGAAFLHKMNPYWSIDEYKKLFYTYIQYLIRDANAMSSGNFNEDIALYGPITELTNKMGDVFAEGVFDYITSRESLPTLPGEPCITYEQMRTIQNISMFWLDLEVWLRNYMISKYLKIGDLEPTYNRLKKVVIDYTNELKAIYGEKFAADLLQYFNEYLDLINRLTTAQMTGNTDEINKIVPLLYQNTAARAALQASANPFLSENEWRKRLDDMQVRGILNESTAILAGDIAKSLDIFIDLLTQAESMSDYFELALFNYFTQSKKKQ